MNGLSDDLLLYISKFLDNHTRCRLSDLHKLANYIPCNKNISLISLIYHSFLSSNMTISINIQLYIYSLHHYIPCNKIPRCNTTLDYPVRI